MALLSSLGASREHIHPAPVDGKYTRRTTWFGRALIAFLVLVPWIRIGGSPVFLQDLHARQFYLLGLVFTPRDSVILLSVILGAGFMLFFVTSLWGRLWCGYACPQTVLLQEVIRKIEVWVDGQRGAQVRLQKQPWNAEKIRKRALKWSLFLLAAFVISMSFMGFFADVYRLWTFRSLPATYAVTLSLTAVLFLDFAWFREQFCHYLCPYARLQGVMTDNHTVQIGYHAKRGEPRKPKGMKLKDAGPEIGDCVDCNRCVTVCPSGIDIRDGFQLECIACARCIDACEDVLGKLGRKTLVDYVSQAELDGEPRKRFGLRSGVYALGMAVCAGVLLTTFLTRGSFDITVAQDAATAEITTSDGAPRNLYQLTVHNNATRSQTFDVAVDLAGLALTVPGGSITLGPAERRVLPVFVDAEGGLAASQPVTPFHLIVTTDGEERRTAVTFRNRLR